MNLPAITVSEPSIFSEPFAVTNAYYVQNMSQLRGLVDLFSETAEDRSIPEGILEDAETSADYLPAWITITEYEGNVLGMGRLDLKSVQKTIDEYMTRLRTIVNDPASVEAVNID